MKTNHHCFKSLHLQLSVVLTALLSVCNSAQAIQVTGLFDTGVDDSGHVLASGSVDHHYSVSGQGASTAYAVSPFFMWMLPVTSSWIDPSPSVDESAPSGYYHYTLTFDLSGLDASNAHLSGSWSTDDYGQLFLNGGDTGFSITGQYTFTRLASFDIQSGFVQGLNTLDFEIENNGVGPTGLLVSGLSVTIVPEPSVFSLVALGCGAIILFRRKNGQW